MIDGYCLLDKDMAARIAAVFYNTVAASYNLGHGLADDKEFSYDVNSSIADIYGSGDLALADARVFMEIAGNETPTD